MITVIIAMVWILFILAATGAATISQEENGYKCLKIYFSYGKRYFQFKIGFRLKNWDKYSHAYRSFYNKQDKDYSMVYIGLVLSILSIAIQFANTSLKKLGKDGDGAGYNTPKHRAHCILSIRTMYATQEQIDALKYASDELDKIKRVLDCKTAVERHHVMKYQGEFKTEEEEAKDLEESIKEDRENGVTD